MSDMDATPRPWTWSAKPLPPHDVDVWEAATTAGVARILGGNDQDYGDELVQQLAEANADLIVRAVNEYDSLREHMKDHEDHEYVHVSRADLEALQKHLAAERKRLPEGTRPLHDPTCALCVAPDTAQAHEEMRENKT